MTSFRAAFLLTALCLPAQQLPPKAAAVMKEMGHGEGKLRVGDEAPDFDLKKTKAEERVLLSAWRGKKPVALLFGSFT